MLGGTSITYIVLSSLFNLILNSFSRVHEHLKKLFTFYTTRFIYLIHCFCISAELSSYISFCSVQNELLFFLGKKRFCQILILYIICVTLGTMNNVYILHSPDAIDIIQAQIYRTSVYLWKSSRYVLLAFRAQKKTMQKGKEKTKKKSIT